MVLAAASCGQLRAGEQREARVAVVASLRKWPWNESKASDGRRMGCCSSPATCPPRGRPGTAWTRNVCRDYISGEKGEEARSGGLGIPEPFPPHSPTRAGLGAMEPTCRAHRPSSSGSSGRTDKFSVSGEWSFPPRLVHFPRTRQTPSCPQTVALRLLRPNQFTLKSKPAALYSMHLGRNQNILVGRCVPLLVITVFTSKEVSLRCA